MKKYKATVVVLNNKNTVNLLPDLISDLMKKIIVVGRDDEVLIPCSLNITAKPFPEVDGIRFDATIKSAERFLTIEEYMKTIPDAESFFPPESDGDSDDATN